MLWSIFNGETAADVQLLIVHSRFYVLCMQILNPYIVLLNNVTIILPKFDRIRHQK